MSDSARRGVIESQANKGGWLVVRFADKSRSIRGSDLRVLPSDAASFELSQAPLSGAERQASTREASKRGLSVAASTNECAEYHFTMMAGTLGPAFAS